MAVRQSTDEERRRSWPKPRGSSRSQSRQSVTAVPQNIATSTPEGLKEFLDSFDCVLLDCEGGLMRGPNLIPGVGDTIKHLQGLGKTVKVFSNNCCRTTNGWKKLFARFECTLSGSDVAFPARTIAMLMTNEGLQGQVFVLGPAKLTQELKSRGFDIYEYDPEEKPMNPDEIWSSVTTITDDPLVSCVVVDLDINIDYRKMMKAAIIASRPDVLLIFGGEGKTINLGNMVIAGPNFIQTAIEQVSGKTGSKTGKPSFLFNKFLVKEFGVEPERTLFVGDSILSDMAFAKTYGYLRMLVFTGIATEEDLMNCPQELKPEYYLESFGDLYEIFNESDEPNTEE